MKTYNFFIVPGNSVAFSLPYETTSLKEAKQMVREFLGINRLPNGTQIW